MNQRTKVVAGGFMIMFLLAGIGTMGFNTNNPNINYNSGGLFFNEVVYERANNFVYIDMDYYPEYKEYTYLLPVAYFQSGHEYTHGFFEPGRIVYAFNNPKSVENNLLERIDIYAQTKDGDRYMVMQLSYKDLTNMNDFLGVK